MITKMKKYTFLVFYRQYESFLTQLRDFGLVHITTKNVDLEANETLQESVTYFAKLQSIIAQAKSYCTNPISPAKTADIQAFIEQWEDTTKQLTTIDQDIQATQKEATRMQIWGDFSAKKMASIASAGYPLHFYTCPKSAFDESFGAVVNESNNVVYFVAVENVNPLNNEGCTEQTLNKHNYSELLQDITALEAKKQAIINELQQLANQNVTALQDEELTVHQSIDWQKVELNTTDLAEGSVKYVEGFCPLEQSKDLDALLEKEHIYYESTDPTAEDTTPIQLKNNFFTKLFEPITRLYSLPNYAEIDPTPFFAPFFMLFFGLCLGDGGYGLLILVAGIYLILKKPDLKNWGWLATFMGFTTMVVGILTGMFFGINLEEVAFLAPVKQYFITETNASVHVADGSYHPMMVFAVAIGIFQILFAMGFKSAKIILQKGLKYALYDIAWLVFLITGIVWLFTSPQGTALYVFYGILGLCALFILFYSDPDKKILIANLGGGLWGTYNMVSGLLGDVLSYIRLFALGLAGGILGNVFNSLALQVGEGMPAWIGWLPMLFIMLFGHGLNFALCLISSVVHPLRLTFVEFYKNADFEGGGLEYKPFQKLNK